MSALVRNHPKGASDERRLLQDLKKATSNTKGRWVMRCCLSKLNPKGLSDQALRATESTFNSLVTQHDARFYWLRNNDFMVFFKAPVLDSVRSALVKVRFLFAGDPLLEQQSDSVDGANDEFARWIPLDRNHGELLAEVKGMVSQHTSVGQETPRRTLRGPNSVISGRKGAPLTPALLERVVNALMGADLSSHVRRQSVCALIGRGFPDPVFTEVFVSIADLREAMLPHINLASNPWLFQHMTQTLDRRVLAMLTRRDDRTLEQGFSINLNVATILSDEFIRFDDSLAPGTHGTVVIELRSEDIFSDLNAFFFARDFVRQRGYRLCVDGLDWRTLPFVDPSRLGVDLMKLSWVEDLPHALKSDDGAGAMAVIQRIGQGKIILARCDDERAISFGKSLGLTLFQGRHLDKILRPTPLL